MKKLIVSVAAIAALTFAQAQEVFKPNPGAAGLEVIFNPGGIFGSNNGNVISLPSMSGFNQGIKYRLFDANNMVYRGTFLFGFTQFSDPLSGQYIDANGDVVNVDDLANKRNEWAVQIRPGFERHFLGTDRLSPYMGAELILGFGGNSETSEELKPGTETGERIETKITNQSPSAFVGQYLPGFTVGLAGLAGFDYYIAPHLYMGAEISYAILYNKQFKSTLSVTDQDDIETKGGSTFAISPELAMSGMIRLGWTF